MEGEGAHASCEESRMNHVGRRRVCIIEGAGEYLSYFNTVISEYSRIITLIASFSSSREREAILFSLEKRGLCAHQVA